MNQWPKWHTCSHDYEIEGLYDILLLCNSLTQWLYNWKVQKGKLSILNNSDGNMTQMSTWDSNVMESE